MATLIIFTFIFNLNFVDRFVAVVVLGLNSIFQHTIGYTWRSVLMVEEETRKSADINTDPREPTGQLSHISTFAES
jgi:hypothetical protein